MGLSRRSFLVTSAGASAAALVAGCHAGDGDGNDVAAGDTVVAPLVDGFNRRSAPKPGQAQVRNHLQPQGGGFFFALPGVSRRAGWLGEQLLT